MLPEKPWRLSALLRLVGGVLICYFAASVFTAIVAYFKIAHPPNALEFFGAAVAALFGFGLAAVTLSGRWELVTIPRRLGMVTAGFYGGLLLGFLSEHLLGKQAETDAVSMARMIGGTLFSQLAVLALLSRFLDEHEVSWVEAFGLNRGVPSAILLGIVGVMIALPVGLALQSLSSAAMEAIKMHPNEQAAVKALQGVNSPLAQVLFGIMTIAGAPVVEEILFRGLLFPALRRSGRRRLALWITAILFAAMHMNLVTFLSLMFLGLLLAMLYERTGNLLASIVTHGLFNAVNFSLLIFQSHHQAAAVRALTR